MKHLSQLLKETVPVIIGILLALFINNWNEDRKDKIYLNQIFSSINNELNESRIDIIESIPKQQVLIDSLKIYINDETVSIFDIIMKAGGVQGPTIKNNSWKAISNSRIELVEFDKLSALSEIDETVKSIEFKGHKVSDFIFENIKKTNEEKKEIFILLIQELISTEKHLQFEIEELLKNENIINKD